MGDDDTGVRLGPETAGPLSYVIPLRRWRPESPGSLTPYLEWLAPRAEVIVIDGSSDEIFSAHRETWGHLVRHEAVRIDLRTANGKVGGVLTGIWAASHEKVVIADDDVRYDHDSLCLVSRALNGCDLVRPQNFFDPLPWHAHWDTARTLINRAFGGDYPGTLAIRRSYLMAVGGYDGDTLFENLELIRTIEATGGRLLNCPWLYVRRVPPSPLQFKQQRVRQAYESFAQPPRMATELSFLPITLYLLLRGRPAVILGAVIASIGLAETGRRRANGRTVFSATSSLLAPMWLMERATCSWLAVWFRLRRGGVPYAGATLKKSATSKRMLQQRNRRAL